MNKSTQKRNTYNTALIKKIADKYDVTTRYVRQSLTGDRTGIFPDKMKSEYKSASIELEKANAETEKKINQLINKDV